MDTPAGEDNRMRGIRIVLDWLEAQPGDTWQQRWLASGAGRNGREEWRAFPTRWRVVEGFAARHPQMPNRIRTGQPA
jgi:hypothetical protein